MKTPHFVVDLLGSQFTTHTMFSFFPNVSIDRFYMYFFNMTSNRYVRVSSAHTETDTSNYSSSSSSHSLDSPTIRAFFLSKDSHRTLISQSSVILSKHQSSKSDFDVKYTEYYFLKSLIRKHIFFFYVIIVYIVCHCFTLNMLIFSLVIPFFYSSFL